MLWWVRPRLVLSHAVAYAHALMHLCSRTHAASFNLQFIASKSRAAAIEPWRSSIWLRRRNGVMAGRATLRAKRRCGRWRPQKEHRSGFPTELRHLLRHGTLCLHWVLVQLRALQCQQTPPQALTSSNLGAHTPGLWVHTRGFHQALLLHRGRLRLQLPCKDNRTIAVRSLRFHLVRYRLRLP